MFFGVIFVFMNWMFIDEVIDRVVLMGFFKD